MPGVRVTFGMIVLNGLPFIKYNLEALYPFAHEIIVVEGACRAAAANARPSGHSLDGTWEFLQAFVAAHDPEHKVKLVTAEDEGQPDGFWLEKEEMSQAYARRATGNYLWQVDSDEFYMPGDMSRVKELLDARPGIKTVSFAFFNFWGGPAYVLDGFSFRTFDHMVHRVFAWGPGYRYVTHRPPTVVNEKGQDLKQVGWLSKRATARMNIRMYHYDMILPKQAACKSAYYSNVDWHMLENGKVADWKHRVFDCLERPFHIYTVYTHLSWLNRYRGAHPPPVEWMLRDIQAGLWPGMELRRTDDIERMLRSARFRLLRSLASVSTTIEAYLYYGRSILRRFLMRTPAWVTVQRLRGRNPA